MPCFCIIQLGAAWAAKLGHIQESCTSIRWAKPYFWLNEYRDFSWIIKMNVCMNNSFWKIFTHFYSFYLNIEIEKWRTDLHLGNPVHLGNPLRNFYTWLRDLEMWSSSLHYATINANVFWNCRQDTVHPANSRLGEMLSNFTDFTP